MMISTEKNFLDEKTFAKCKAELNRLVESGHMDFDKSFGRLYAHRPAYFDYLHKTKIWEMAKRKFGENVKPSYCFISHYNRSYSICPPHSDRAQCKYTIDIVISQKEKWPIYIDYKEFILEENECVCYSGTDHWHWRRRIKSGNEASLVFWHFTDKDFKGSLN